MPPRKTLHHAAVAVANLDEAIPVWERITGATATGRETVASQDVEVVFFGSGSGMIELIAPATQESGVFRFLERRGSGLHHLCYQVADINAALQEYRSEGFVAIDQAPRAGAHGHLVAFLHPRSATGVLIELLQEAQS